MTIPVRKWLLFTGVGVSKFGSIYFHCGFCSSQGLKEWLGFAIVGYDHDIPRAM